MGDGGQRLYEEQRKSSLPPLKLAKAQVFTEYAEQQMQEEKFTPETLSGTVCQQGFFQENVCAKTLLNEIDQCLLSVRNTYLPLTLDERTPHFRHIIRIANRSTSAVELGLQQLQALCGDRFSTSYFFIIGENGRELALFLPILPDATIYDAHPCPAYERSLNEKQNSLR